MAFYRLLIIMYLFMCITIAPRSPRHGPGSYCAWCCTNSIISLYRFSTVPRRNCLLCESTTFGPTVVITHSQSNILEYHAKLSAPRPLSFSLYPPEVGWFLPPGWVILCNFLTLGLLPIKSGFLQQWGIDLLRDGCLRRRSECFIIY